MSVSVQAFSVFRFAGMGNGLKSTQEQQERKQKCASQVDFFEKQKQNLKHMECTTLEEIARKLEMFHSYEDQIAAAKQQFNNSQMGHVLDEAKEIGEKIAEEAEKTAPKTPEEREKDRIEEAAGSEEENDGMLSEVLDEISGRCMLCIWSTDGTGRGTERRDCRGRIHRAAGRAAGGESGGRTAGRRGCA